MGIEKFPEDVGELEQEGKEQKDKWCPLVVGDLCILKRDQKKVNIQERTLKPIHSKCRATLRKANRVSTKTKAFILVI